MSVIVNAPNVPEFQLNMCYDEGEGQWFAKVKTLIPGPHTFTEDTVEFHDGDYGTVLSAVHGHMENRICERMHLERVYGFTLGGRFDTLGVSGIVATTAEEVLGLVYKYLGRNYDSGTIEILKSHFNYDHIGTEETDEFVKSILIEEGTAAWIGGDWKWENTGGTVFSLVSDRDVNRTA